MRKILLLPALLNFVGRPLSTEIYSDIENKWYNVSYYSPKKGYTAAIFSDITYIKENEKELKLLNLLVKELLKHFPILKTQMLIGLLYLVKLQ